MNLVLIRPRIPSAVLRFAPPATPLMHRLLAPPRRLLALAAAVPAAWPKRLLDLTQTAFRASSLRPGDTAILGRTLGRARALRKIPAAYASPLIQWILPKSPDMAGGAPPPGAPPPDATAEALPLWELVNTNAYPIVSIPVCESPPSTPGIGRRFRAANSVVDELDRLAKRCCRGPIHLYAPDTSWNSGEGLALLAALAHRGTAPSTRPLRAELTVTDAADPEVVSSMTSAGIRDVVLTLPLGGEATRTTVPDDRSLIQLLKRLQRAGLQICGGVPLRDRSATWADFARDVERLRDSGMDRTLIQLLGSPIGTRHAAAAVRAAWSSGLASMSTMRTLLGACLRSGVRPSAIPLAMTIAVYSQLQYAVDALT